MANRSWGFLLALGLTLASLGQAQEPESPPEQSFEAVDPSPALQGIEAAIRELAAEEDEREQRAQERREQRDLAAQEAMAFWAEWMTYATGATVFLTLIGLAALIRTLHHTKRAADYTGTMLDEAKRATEAAQATVDITKRIGEAQTRAYLSIERVTLFFPDPDNMTLDVVVKNTGQSPAVRVCLAVQLAGYVEIDDVEQEQPILGGIFEFGNIGAGSEEPMSQRASVKYLPDWLRQGQTRRPLFIVGIVGVYASDVFDRSIFEFAAFNIAQTEVDADLHRSGKVRNLIPHFGSAYDVRALHRQLREHHDIKRNNQAMIHQWG